jgi:hypothetical protein
VGAKGADGAPTLDGGNGLNAYGGAIYATGASLTLMNNSAVVANTAIAGKGGNGGDWVGPFIGPGNGGNGGDAEGGGIYANGVGLSIANSFIWSNDAVAGKGGAGGQGGSFGPNLKSFDGGEGGGGGHAAGGGLDAEMCPFSIHDTSFLTDQAEGGTGGDAGQGVSGGMGGPGGMAIGGGIVLDQSRTPSDLTNVTLTGNKALAGNGSDGADADYLLGPVPTSLGGKGGAGGIAMGGGLAAFGDRGTGTADGTINFTGLVTFNSAVGGLGGAGGMGGRNLGLNNAFTGGHGGDGGHGGAAGGGGMWFFSPA